VSNADRVLSFFLRREAEEMALLLTPLSLPTTLTIRIFFLYSGVSISSFKIIQRKHEISPRWNVSDSKRIILFPYEEFVSSLSSRRSALSCFSTCLATLLPPPQKGCEEKQFSFLDKRRRRAASVMILSFFFCFLIEEIGCFPEKNLVLSVD